MYCLKKNKLPSHAKHYIKKLKLKSPVPSVALIFFAENAITYLREHDMSFLYFVLTFTIIETLSFLK